MTNYNIMRVIVMFDLPTLTKKKEENTIASNNLVDDGFIMMQYSVYTRFCCNIQDASKHINRVKAIVPQKGNVRILTVTERQFEDMIVVIGERTETEKLVNGDYVVVIE